MQIPLPFSLMVCAALAVVACSGPPSSAESASSGTNDGTVVATSETRAALGVDHWGVAYAGDRDVPTITMSGYDEAGALRTELALRSSGADSEARWLELVARTRPNVAMHLPITSADEPVVVLGRDTFGGDTVAKTTLQRLRADLDAVGTASMTPRALHPLSPSLVHSGGPLIEGGLDDCIAHLTACLGACNVTQGQIAGFCHDTLLANTAIGSVPMWFR